MNRTFVMGSCLLAALTALTAVLWGQAPLPATPKRVALLVGVDKYLEPGLDNLRFSQRDVLQIAEELRKQGFTVKVLLGSAEGADQATRANILRFSRNMARNLGKDDLALVMLSGHGQQLEVKRPDGSTREEAFYIPVEGVARNGETLVSLSELIDDILASKVGRKLLLVDACRELPKNPNLGARGVQGKVIALPEDMAVFFSCGAGQRSCEKEELQHGLFTYYLLEGLRGAAARNNDVAWSDLVTHVQRRMDSADARKLLPPDETQRPIAVGEVEHTILAKVDGGPLPTTLPRPKPQPPQPPAGPPALLVSPFTAAQAQEAQQAWARHLGKASHLEKNRGGMQLVLIPPGEFDMGSPAEEQERKDDETPHRVRITKPFYLGMHEVTQAEYQQVMGSNPSWFSRSGYGQEAVVGRDTTRFPVELVSWDQAAEFCRRLSQREGKTYRLPTEAEWEYACRAGTTTPFHFDAQSNGRESNINGEYPYGTTEKGPQLARPTTVGSYPANPFGLYDMHGNVSEWCQDWYGEKYYDSVADRTTNDPLLERSDNGNRVLRGGSWDLSARLTRAAFRLKSAADYRNSDVGFRVVRTP